MKKILFVLAAASLLSACTPEVGSDKWCKSIEAKGKGDISAKEAGNYAKHCLLGHSD